MGIGHDDVITRLYLIAIGGQQYPALTVNVDMECVSSDCPSQYIIDARGLCYMAYRARSPMMLRETREQLDEQRFYIVHIDILLKEIVNIRKSGGIKKKDKIFILIPALRDEASND